jgi:hypothetical protein
MGALLFRPAPGDGPCCVWGRPSLRRGKVLIFSECNSHPAPGSLQPVAIGAAVEVTGRACEDRQSMRGQAEHARTA